MKDFTTISLYEDEDINSINIQGATLKMLKHSKRYREIVMPSAIVERIMIYALKGQNCDTDHLDICQRSSLYKLSIKSKSTDPYIQQFIKDTEEHFPNIILDVK